MKTAFVVAIVNVSPESVTADVVVVEPLFATTSVNVVVPYESETSEKLTPRADDAGPVALVTALARLVVNAVSANAKVISETSFAFACGAAEPVKVNVATVALVRVSTGVRPAGTLPRVTSDAVSPAFHVSPERVITILPVTAPVFAVVSVNPRPLYATESGSLKSTIKSAFA